MPGGNSPVPSEYIRGLYGSKLKEEARRYYGSFINLACRGEMLPNENCYAELDPTVKDKWGIPVLRWHWKWTDHELNMAMHAERTFASIIEAMGGKVRGTPAKTGLDIIRPGGNVKHEVGGARMGEDPKDSVCNSMNQTWDVKNLFLTDAAPFVTNADKNPTLSIMAFSWRSLITSSNKLGKVTSNIYIMETHESLPRLSRREVLKWFAAAAAASQVTPFLPSRKMRFPPLRAMAPIPK